MSFDFFEKIPEFLKFGFADLAKILIGAFIVGFMAINWVKSISKATKSQIEAEFQKTQAQIGENKADFHKQVAELKTQQAKDEVTFQKALIDAQESHRVIEQDRSRLSVELSSLQTRLENLESFDGRL